MSTRETLINKIERGRAKFAYECAEQGKKIKNESLINGENYKDDNYASHIKKIPQMILSNGLGQTLAYIAAKRTKEKKKEKENIKPGEKNNPKNGYDLIYLQLTEYLKSDSTTRIKLPENIDLLEWVISCNSTDYRYITQEILAFLNWLKRFVEGMIEEEG